MTTILLIIIYIAFISLGLPDSMLGSAWPTIQTELSLPISGAGLISMIISCGTILSSINSGLLLKRLGSGKVTLISVLMTAIALLGFSLSKSYLWLCLMAVPLGLGAGAVDSALNNFVAIHFSAKHMSWLHCFWGIGATSGPIIMSYAILKRSAWQQGYLIVSMIQFSLVFILFISLPIWKAFQKQEIAIEEQVKETNTKIFNLPGIYPALMGVFSYCALELTTGLWGASYFVKAKGVDPHIAARFVSMYYLGITLGRLVNGFITSKFSNSTLIRFGQIFIGFGVVLLLLINITYINLVGLVLVGLGCAPIYPSMLHETPVRFGKENSSKLMGIQMGFAYLGSTLVPPLSGLLLGTFSIKLYPFIILVLFIIMIISSEKINLIMTKKLR